MFSQSVIEPVYSFFGGHFPYNAYIGGIPVIGKLWDLFSKDGRGLDRIIMQAATVAEQNNGIAWWRFGPMKNAALIVKPEDIKAIIKDHLDNLCMHDSTGSFKMFFGPESIFNTPYKSDKWNELRPKFLKVLFREEALKKDAQPMQLIIDKHMNKITMTNTLSDLEQFCNSITMDMIGIKLGIKNISEDDKHKISSIIAEGTVEVANPWNQIISPYIPGYKFENTKLYSLMTNAWEILRKIVRENEDNIRSTPNWLSQDSKNDKDYFTQDVIYNITQFLVAGHETTAKLLLMSLMLLADSNHAAVLNKLRLEIDEQNTQPGQWTRDTIKNMPYMEAVINEVLRLYPPIPDMIVKIDKAFSFGNGKFTFNNGDLAVISQRVTGWSKQVWGTDVAEFKPERFLDLKNNAAEKELLPYKYFPFGFAPRQCVGQLFSKQEVALTLARIVKNFDFSLEQQEGKELHHPFPFHQIFSLRVGLHDIGMRFKTRSAMPTHTVMPAHSVMPA